MNYWTFYHQKFEAVSDIIYTLIIFTLLVFKLLWFGLAHSIKITSKICNNYKNPNINITDLILVRCDFHYFNKVKKKTKKKT